MAGLRAISRIEDHPLPWLAPLLNSVEHANPIIPSLSRDETRATEYSKAATRGNWQYVWSSFDQRRKAKDSAANEVGEATGRGCLGMRRRLGRRRRSRAEPRMKRTLAAALAIATLGGCVSMGTNFDPAVVEQLQPGMTKPEVIARLGQPNSRSIMANGQEVMVWLHSQGTAWGTARARSVSLLFDSKEHYVRTINSTQTQAK